MHVTRWIALLMLLTSFESVAATQSATPERAATPVAVENVLVGAGDIATCENDNDDATAKLLDDIDGTVFTLGDNVYESGTLEEFGECFDPNWGRHLDRIRPSVGNHEYETDNAEGYFDHFGESAGSHRLGYYSYDLGTWHIIVLNSNCEDVGGCDANSAQANWLRADLAANPAECTLAYWHHPLFSSGDHGGSTGMAAIWSILMDAGADVVLSAHDHNYERFALQDAAGNADEDGMRQFVVGTGGRSLRGLKDIQANSEVANDDTYGVLKLNLNEGGYEWEFIPVEGSTFTDSGSDSCQ